MKKKPKPGAKSSAKPQTKVEPVESFFHWFKAPEVRNCFFVPGIYLSVVCWVLGSRQHRLIVRSIR